MGVVLFLFFFFFAFSEQTEEQTFQERTIRSEFMELIQGSKVPKSCTPLPDFRIQAPADLHGLISSPGGTGSTHVLRMAQTEHFSINRGNAEHLKHTHLPPYHNSSFIRGQKIKSSVPPVNYDAFKAIFVYGDPAFSLISLFRRGFYKKQIRDTTGRSCRLPVLHKKLHYNKTESPWFLESYARHGQYDIFRFNEFYINWIFSDTPYDRIFISGHHSEDILRYFPIRDLFLHPSFSPAHRSIANLEDLTWQVANSKKVIELNTTFTRNAAKYEWPEQLLADLRSPFQALQLFIDNLPLIFVRPGTRNTRYNMVNASTFEQKLADKFIGDFNMDDLLDTPIGP